LAIVDDCVVSLRNHLTNGSHIVDISGGVEASSPPAAPSWTEENVKSLLDTLTKGTDLTEDLVQAPYLRTILAVIRRPRSHLALVALLQHPDPEHQPKMNLKGEQVELSAITPDVWRGIFGRSSPVKEDEWDLPCKLDTGERHGSGGLLWVPRQAHNSAYGALTDKAHSTVRKILKQEVAKPEDTKLASLSLLVVAILHRRASRYFFSGIYEATGDITALREYIYHRVSCLRTLCRLLILTKGYSPQDECDLRASFQNGIILVHFPQDRWKAENPPPDWTKIRREIRNAWLQELRAFRATLSREIDAVRRQLYAGAWLSLIERIRAMDVAEMFHENSFMIDEDEQVENACALEIASLKDDLDRQEIDFRFEKADWDGTETKQIELFTTLVKKAACQKRMLIIESSMRNASWLAGSLGKTWRS
jgi:hypothetical protein